METITEKLNNSTDKPTTKGIEIAKIPSLNVQRVDYRIEITNITPVDSGVRVYFRAWDKKGQIGFGANGDVDIERLNIINPPILVPDGTTHLETDPRTLEQYPVDNYKEDAQEALLQVIEQTIKVKKQKFDSKKIITGKIGKTTSTFYPAAGAISPVDGEVWWSAGATSFTSARGNAGTNSANLNTAGSAAVIGASTTTNLYDFFLRSIFGFNTAAITASNTISSATFSLRGVTSTLNNLSQSMCVGRRVPTSASSLATGDYNVGGWDTAEQATNRISLGSWSTAGYNNFTLSSTGLDNINKTGLSWFGGRLSGDLDNIEPTWGSGLYAQVRCNFADVTGTTNDPKLVVEHASSSVNSGFFSLMV